MAVKAVVIAGTTSGVGKTTVATGIMAALTRRGLKVQPFKAGPDYIDPSYHTWASGRPSRNLDTWLLPHQAVAELFQRATSGTDIAVIEGVMGLYDGHSSLGEAGSTAELAKLLGAPVVLVVDAHGAARSLAAMVGGYAAFDPALRLGGVVLNGTGSPGHIDLCREAIESATGIPVLGGLPRHEGLRLPERHLGLVPMVEGPAGREYLERLVAQVESAIDLDRLVKLAGEAAPPYTTPTLFPTRHQPPRTRLAVAQDRAFSFYYEDSLDLLRAWGAEVVPFSPLKDSALPPGVDGIYLGGGFPELYAGELAENRGMQEAIRRAAQDGVPVYGECGGLMYLGQGIRDFEGREFPMVGLVPACSVLQPALLGKGRRLTLGYRTVRALRHGPLLRQGEEVRGHEFHWSVLEEDTGDSRRAYRVIDQGGRREGFHTGSVLASYIHLHLASRPFLAQRLVEACQRYRQAAAK
ncbi:MAG: cobyrinate a,c-diamide synthase [Dehalococcoidia bacterium]